MKKIPTLFARDFDHDPRYVTKKVAPGCEWVLNGEGVATRKYDGTCVMLDNDGQWWARREVKPGKQPPPGFVEIGHDQTTGKFTGWEPIKQSSFAKFHAQALDAQARYHEGTYELCGPKVNRNPENFPVHRLISHDDAEVFTLPSKLDYSTCRRAVLDLAKYGHEGIVWHHPDGRMAKLKGRDFPVEGADHE
jgi:hypothetical protein